MATTLPRPRLELAPGEAGQPLAAVPPHWLWDLVEYLSSHRVAVRYLHRADAFLVSFEHSTLAAARRLLDDWAH